MHSTCSTSGRPGALAQPPPWLDAARHHHLASRLACRHAGARALLPACFAGGSRRELLLAGLLAPLLQEVAPERGTCPTCESLDARTRYTTLSLGRCCRQPSSAKTGDGEVRAHVWCAYGAPGNHLLLSALCRHRPRGRHPRELCGAAGLREQVWCRVQHAALHDACESPAGGRPHACHTTTW